MASNQEILQKFEESRDYWAQQARDLVKDKRAFEVALARLNTWNAAIHLLSTMSGEETGSMFKSAES